MIGENNFIGKQIDTFRLITEISSGQLNSTYKAEQLQAAPRVVIFKLFHAIHLPEPKRERFLQEIRLLKKVKHPHILPILDGGFYEDSPYIVSEYAAHGSLRDRLNTQSTQFLPMQEAVTIIANIGRALQFFHQINITHKNLKPENILVNEQGKILLADSSIVTIADSIPIERAHNSSTFPYMAPEQFHGRANKESDQYALGCIAYELLTGIAPFAGSDFRSMASTHANEAVVPPTQLNMLLPVYIQKAILTAMAKQETNRYPHIKDFIVALTSSTKAQNVAISVPLAATTQPPNVPLIQQAQEDSTVTTLQDDKPPDTPAIDKDRKPILSAQEEPVPIPRSPGFVDRMDSPPDTPEPSVEDAEENELPAHIESYEVKVEESLFGDDIATQPSLEVVPSLNNKHTPQAPADLLMNGIEEPAIVYGAGMPVEAAQARPNDQARKHTTSNWLLLPNKFVLLVGISWVVIAVLVLSMVFIIIPSARPFTNVVSPVVQKTTPRPTLKPTPTAHATAKPTVRPTAKPAPSPTSSPTPSPTPQPSPSPSPITILALTVSPTSLNGPTDCQSVQFGFKCTVTLTLPQNYPGNAHWSASSSGNITVLFVPQRGTLSPGQQQTVNVFAGKTCSHNSTFIFSTQNSNAVVSWRC